MKSTGSCSRSEDFLDTMVNDVTEYLRRYASDFSSKQFLLSYQITDLLAKLMDELDMNNVKKARKLSMKIDSKLFELCSLNYS